MTLPAAALPSPVSAQNGTIGNTHRPPTDPADWTLNDAQGIVAAQTPQWIPTARAFVVDGDHWQNGTGWIGPMPLPGSEGYAETALLIRNGFTFRNALAEVSKRYTNGVVGAEGDWSMTPTRPMEADDDEPTPEEQTLIDEVEAALTEWWDRDKIGALFWQFVYQMSWGQRSAMRLFLSRSAFVDVGTDPPADSSAAAIDAPVASDDANGAESKPKQRKVPKQATLADALRLILLDVPKLENAAVYMDPDTHREVGVYLFKTRDGNDAAEISYVDAGQVVIRTLGGVAPETVEADLRGHLPHYQVIRQTRLLTDAAFSLQRALNLALSVVPRTITTAGFLERVLFNAKMPGKWIDVGGKKTWQPEPNIGFGAGSTANLQGIEYTDEQGKKVVKDPSITYRPPVDAGPSVDAADKIYGALLAEVGQAHIMLSSEAAPSGRSRREARADYESSLEEGVHPIENAGRWLLGAVLSLAEYLMQSPGKYTERLRPVFNVIPDAGPLEPEDRTQNLEEWQKGARSLESVMLQAGIKDPDAEQSRISQERGARLDMLRRQAEVAQLWIDLGASVALVGELVGLDDEIVEQLEKDRALQEPKGNANTDPAGGNNGDPEGGNPGDGGEGDTGAT